MANTFYQKLEYLDNGKAGNVIDINLTNISICGFDITCSFPVASTPKAALWGHRYDSSNTYKFYPFYTTTSLGYQAGSTYYSLTSHTIELNAKYRFIVNGGSLRPKGYQLYKNDVQFYSAEKAFIASVKSKSIHLYASNDAGNFKHPIRARIYNAKFYINYSNTSLGKDLIPAKRVSDGVCGLFDTISKEFYTSLSDSTKYEFTGPELNEYFDENYNSVVPATLKEKLEHINETKSLIKNAIISKGQAVADTDTFRSYADKISAIVGGGLSEEDYDTCLDLSKEILLPPEPEYTVLEKLHNQTKAYIDTGINPYGKKLKYEFKFGPVLGKSKTAMGLFGGYNAAEAKNLGTMYGIPDGYGNGVSWNLYGKSSNLIASDITKNRYSMGYRNDNIEGYFEIDETTYSYRFIADQNGSSFEKEDVVLEGSGTVSGEFPQTPTITLFCQNSDNGAVTDSPARTDVFYFKIYLDDIVVRDFIPVKDSDGTVCLYDKVSRTFFYAQNGSLNEGGLA